MTTLYGWGPMFGAPGPSPFVMKTDIQLQMLDVDFDRAIADLESVTKHKAPYVEDDGAIIEDSTFIRRYFEKKTGRSLDAPLSRDEHLTGWAFEKMLENHLTPIMAMERWLIEANFNKGPAMFFADVPEAARQQVLDDVRAQISATMIGQGIGRHSREERMELANLDITSVSLFLDEKDFFFGDEPTGVDAFAYAILASCGTDFFDTPLTGLVDKHANLRPYLARMEARFFSDVEWPAMAA